MTKSICAAVVGVVFMTGMLCGCNKTPRTDSNTSSSSAPAAPASDVKGAGQGTAPSASAGIDVSVQGTEARAGDVSVKLPD